MNIRISLGIKLTVKNDFWIFGPNFSQKVLPSKTEKVITAIEFCIFELE